MLLQMPPDDSPGLQSVSVEQLITPSLSLQKQAPLMQNWLQQSLAPPQLLPTTPQLGPRLTQLSESG
jgi:hypothetical protein